MLFLSTNDILLIDAKTHKLLWHGEVTDIQAASDSKKDRQKYIKCLKIDKEFNRVKKVKSAKQFLDYKIDSNTLANKDISILGKCCV